MIGYGSQPSVIEPRWEDLGQTDAYAIKRLWLQVLPEVWRTRCSWFPTASGALVVAQHGLWYSEEACGFVHDAIARLQLSPHGHTPGRARLRRAGAHMVGGFHKRGGSVRALGKQEWARARTQLYRKAYLIGERLIGTEFMCTSRLLDYVSTLPEVDPDRIGFYGLSQGGQSALFFPAVETRIKATVSSAFFQRRIGKMIDYDYARTPYVKTFEEDKFFANWLRYFDDSGCSEPDLSPSFRC